MVSFSLIATFALAGLASAFPAPAANDSPNVAYTATLNSNNVTGTFNFTGADGKVGISLSISQTPLEGGPFFYYLQDSCSGPNGIFNPYNGSFPTGNDSIPVSDVALGNFPNNGYVGNGFGEGLFGAGNPGWSLNPQNKAFIGNLTVVFQYANKTPIACTKLEQISTKPSKSGASKIAGAAAALPLAAGVAALLI